jgi:hypothetical protein
MARLLPLLIAAALVAGLAWLLRRALQAPPPAGGRGTFRPHARWRRPAADAAPAGAVQVLRRAQLAGLRDAYSSAPIDPDAELFACTRCQAVYHHHSVVALERDNDGRCVGCGGRAFGPVRVDDRPAKAA